MRLSIRLAAVLLAAGLTGCATSRPEPVRAPERAEVAVSEAAADTVNGPARVGLAATMDLPENPYGDTAAVDLGDLSMIDGVAEAEPLGYGAASGTDPNAVTVSRYYYDDEGTYYYEDVEADLIDYGQGADDDYYYGGYYADYYRYSDPAYYPSYYSYYRPYRVYRPYLRYGWYPTWHHRRWATRYYAGYHYDHYYDPYAWGYYDPYWHRPGVYVSIGWGWGSYGSGYRHGYYDGYHAGYYGPGYYGRPRHRGYYSGYRYNGTRRGDDDGVRGPVRGIPGSNSSPIAQSTPNPSRQPARRGLAPARLPRVPADGGITRSTGRSPVRADRPARTTAPTRGDRPTRAGTPGRTTPSRGWTPERTTSPARTDRPTRSAEPRSPRRTEQPAPRTDRPTRTEAPRRAPRRTERYEPPPRERPAPRTERPSRTRRDAPPRRETRPAPRRERTERYDPPPRRERTRRDDPPPRRESRPAPPPRQESRPAPPPRRESSRPARSRSGDSGRSPRRSRRGND